MDRCKIWIYVGVGLEKQVLKSQVAKVKSADLCIRGNIYINYCNIFWQISDCQAVFDIFGVLESQ